VIDAMWSVRSHEAGWSKTEYYSGLPQYQKLWLDDVWVQEREESDDWLNKVVEDFSRWIVLTYNKSQRKQGTSWGDVELSHVETFVKRLVDRNREALR
jgi:CRISPR-associated protein Csy1